VVNLATTSAPARALRLDGRAEPIYWDGAPDPDRPVRSFTVWLADDAYRTPLKMVMPIGIGEIQVDLVSLTRSPRGRPSFLRRLYLAHLTRWIRPKGSR
jgi:hypothetical protein